MKRCVLCDEKFDQAKRVGNVPYCGKHTFRQVGRWVFYPKEKGGKIKVRKNHETKKDLRN